MTEGRSSRGRLLALLAFLALVLAAGALIGKLASPGAWYAGIDKPAFNPPARVFGPVWTVLYAAIAVAGWRIWTVARHSRAMAAWVVQMILNWLWSPVFFGLESPWLALAVIVALLATIAWFIREARRIDGIASWLFVPYAAWVGFATLLNASIAWMN